MALVLSIIGCASGGGSDSTSTSSEQAQQPDAEPSTEQPSAEQGETESENSGSVENPGTVEQEPQVSEPEPPTSSEQDMVGVQQVSKNKEGEVVRVRVLSDSLLHVNYATSDQVLSLDALNTDMVVDGVAHVGPNDFSERDGRYYTGKLSFRLNDDLCVEISDLALKPLTTLCAPDLESSSYQLSVASPATQSAYGLGAQFFREGQNGDWLGRRREPGIYSGNRMVGFSGGAVSNLQIPVLLTQLPNTTIGYYVDTVEAMTWDLSRTPWRIESESPSSNVYLWLEDDLKQARSQYMQLTGTPPVPPKTAFGLWVSEYGYDNWGEAEQKIEAQQAAKMPLDGLILDLQWFGGINKNQMGSLTWDSSAFPNPASRLSQWQNEWGVKAVTIEESYIDTQTGSYDTLDDLGYLVRECPGCSSSFFSEWWGNGGMFDWTHQQGAAYWHEQKRVPLIEAGIVGHWTDLGEPENFDPGGWYADTYHNQRHEHEQVHNLYNFYWSQSIFDGYQQHHPAKRPWILSRSGTAGSQRFGTSFWSGDIGTNESSLAAHMQVQMHMSLSGYDYFGSDIGGFHRGAIGSNALNELYTLWFANGALLDIPLRPHVENLCNCKETAPSLIGDIDSNRYNLQWRYRMFPYYYSMAHAAYREGTAMFPPLAYYHPDDSNVQGMGEVKYVGPSLIARTYADPDLEVLSTYVPKGQWFDWHHQTWIESQGQQVELSARFEQKTIVPLLAKAGAIIPQMYVDDATMNLSGKRRDNIAHPELIIRVIGSAEQTAFTLYEDDGESNDYQSGAVQQTEIQQQQLADRHRVVIGASEGEYDGMLPSRPNLIELFTQRAGFERVTLNSQPLKIVDSEAAFVAEREAAWQKASGHWWVKTAERSVTETKVLEFW
jgi:alpha-glucosidase